MILIFGDLRDPHVSRVSSLLKDRGCDIEVFSRYSPDSEVAIEWLDGASTLRFHFAGRIVPSDAVCAVWWRQKPFHLYHPDHPERNAAQEFASREWRSLLTCLPAFLPRANWINPVQQQAQASFKPVQFQWASEAGLPVPATAFTNSPMAARALMQRCGRIVYKTYSGYIFPEAKAVFTSEINDVDTLADENAIRIAPGIYQALIEKEYELRVTFVADKLFVTKVDSQSRTDTALDWRRNQEVKIYSPLVLDEAEMGKIRRFVALSGLRFGVLDLIRERSGQLVFLECNPAGQWLWIEEYTGSPISVAVADALASGAARNVGGSTTACS